MWNKAEEKKYKNDEDIELRIELDEYIFFPFCYIKGKFYLNNKKDIKYEHNEINIICKLHQFQKYEYQDGGEKSNQKNDTFRLGEFDKDLKKEKEQSFDINLHLPGNEYKNSKNDFFPTFEYRNKGYSLYVRHLLTIEIPTLNTSNSTGIIICKLPSNIYNDKLLNINDNFIKKSILEDDNKKKIYEFNIKKLNYALNEEIPINLIINNNLKDN